MRRSVRNAKREEIEKIKGGRIKQGGRAQRIYVGLY